jgi:hypothetical protein
MRSTWGHYIQIPLGAERRPSRKRRSDVHASGAEDQSGVQKNAQRNTVTVRQVFLTDRGERSAAAREILTIGDLDGIPVLVLLPLPSSFAKTDRNVKLIGM